MSFYIIVRHPLVGATDSRIPVHLSVKQHSGEFLSMAQLEEYEKSGFNWISTESVLSLPDFINDLRSQIYEEYLAKFLPIELIITSE